LPYGRGGERVAEIVFNTAMTGYEEVLSDPSYAGQFVLFTTSHVGNTGVTGIDMESCHMVAESFICKDLSLIADNCRSRGTLLKLLEDSGRCVLTNVDTRYLAQKVRRQGCMRAILSTEDHSSISLQRKLMNASDISSQDLVMQTRSFSYQSPRSLIRKGADNYKVVVIDCGIKRGILDDLSACGFELHIAGPSATFSEIQAIQPDGLFVSNGPGCPKQLAASTHILQLIREMSSRLPTFGICLGHQLIALAYGGDTQKLSFGHHAVNHPIRCEVDLYCLSRGSVMMTSQNHNYFVTENSISEEFIVTHRHMNDGTVAGMKHKSHPVFSVQFHPESNPGPRDAKSLFSIFLKMMRENGHACSH